MGASAPLPCFSRKSGLITLLAVGLLMTIECLSLSAATRSPSLTLAPFGRIEGGYESNVFLSPSQFVGMPGSPVLSPVTDDTFVRAQAGFDVFWRPAPDQRLNLYFVYDSVQYSSATILNRYGNEVGFNFRQNLQGGWAAGAFGYFENRQERGYDIFGRPYIQTYSYQGFEVGPTLRWSGYLGVKSPGPTGFMVEATVRRADYDEPAIALVQSQDYTEFRVRTRLNQQFSRTQSVYLQYRLENRLYDNYFALKGEGNPSWDYGDPVLDVLRSELTHYGTLATAWQPKKRSRLEFGIDGAVREDLYQGYYSYGEYGFHANALHAFARDWEIKFDYVFARREYKVQDIVIDGPLLRKTYNDFTARLEKKLLKHVKAVATYRLESQETNQVDYDPLAAVPIDYNLPYINHRVWGGLSASW